jgi:hypothetical protein
MRAELIFVSALFVSAPVFAQGVQPVPMQPVQPVQGQPQPAPQQGQPQVVYQQAPPPPGQPQIVYVQAPPPAYAAPPPEDQGRTANNAVFLELLGNGLVYSINYERLFGDSNFSVRLGFSYISIGASGGSASSSVSMITIPVMGNYYVGGRNHKLQLGAGVTFLDFSASAGSNSTFVGTVSGFAPAPTLAIGYRYIPARGGFTFFVGFTPFIIPGNDKVLFPWGGMSFGGVF